MGKNVSFTQKWVKNLVKFTGSEKIFKSNLKVLTLIRLGGWHEKPPLEISVHHFQVVSENDLSLGDYEIQNLSRAQINSVFKFLCTSMKILQF